MKPLFVSKRFRAFIFLFVYIWPSWISKFRLFVWHEQILRLATFTFLRKISWFYVFFSHTHGQAKLSNLGFLPHIKQNLRFRTFSCLRKISCFYFCSPTCGWVELASLGSLYDLNRFQDLQLLLSLERFCAFMFLLAYSWSS